MAPPRSICLNYFCKEENQTENMASNRLQRIGTIYTRVTGLLRSGALKPDEKPLWYDVYEAFPPKYEPAFGRKAPDISIRNIFYAEDLIRAKFYKTFGSPGVISLNEAKSRTPCQKFLEKYQEIEKSGTSFSSEHEVFEATVSALEQEGVILRKTGSPTNPASSATTETFSSMFQSAVQDTKEKAV